MIVFLDIDGVIATPKSYKNEEYFKLDISCIAVLNLLLSNYDNPRIVISSTWRILHDLEELQYMLDHANLKDEVIDITPVNHMSCCRGQEIQAWRTNNKSVEDYIVIDDNVGDIVDIIPNNKILWVKDGWFNNGLTVDIAMRFLKMKT